MGYSCLICEHYGTYLAKIIARCKQDSYKNLTLSYEITQFLQDHMKICKILIYSYTCMSGWQWMLKVILWPSKSAHLLVFSFLIFLQSFKFVFTFSKHFLLLPQFSSSISTLLIHFVPECRYVPLVIFVAFVHCIYTNTNKHIYVP
jgi:hypothetical protein